MASIIIDGREIECGERVSVLQGALEAGWDIPHYCYHPGLSVVASCRLCLMEMKMPHPKTREMGWAPKLMPSCQTPVKDGMEVRFDTAKVRRNQQDCMAYFLLNHPLDCPVCDQAGECSLQDYSRKFGESTGRMVEAKNKNPKKDIGSKTLLYSDRCVMCSRCVRFCDEVAGTGELGILHRGSRSEIDVFPGIPLENELQGNVVDICPVGSLMDKDFLMDQRVWFLKGAKSICPGCSTGCAIRVDHNRGQVWRLKPRFNPGVNDWWMCDEGRFGWKYVHDERRLRRLVVRRGAEEEHPDWSAFAEIASVRFGEVVARQGPGKIAVMLSPFMACEEAWLLATFIRRVDPEATLVMGPVPVEGDDTAYPKRQNVKTSKRQNKPGPLIKPPMVSAVFTVETSKRQNVETSKRQNEEGAGHGNGDVKFMVRAEKCPNRRGIEMILEGLGGSVATFDEFVAKAGKGAFVAAWIVGGYPNDWAPKELASAVGKIGMVFAQDIFPNKVTDAAKVVVPSCSWAERSGCFVNCQGKIQPFDAAIAPLEGCQRDGNYLYALLGEPGLYNAAKVRDRMAASLAQFSELHHAPETPVHAH